MASFEELNIKRADQLELIDQFREYYLNDKDETLELKSETLVSHHDPTIRFTNSTTSVMKPYLERDGQTEQTIFLAQPAMGQQGLYYWQKDGTFGPYASYFASLGALYPSNSGGRMTGIDMQRIVEIWGLPPSSLRLSVHESDQDLVPILEESDIPISVESDNLSSFRHTYGIEGVGGRNANLLTKNFDGVFRTLGNLTLIHAGEDVLGYEVSFDSTTATSLVKNLPHPVQAHTSQHEKVSDREIAYVDMLSVSAALLAEGMMPVSKGRAGVLRKFMLEYARLSVDELKISSQETSERLVDAVRQEVLLRAHMSESSTRVLSPASEVDIDRWVKSRYQ